MPQLRRRLHAACRHEHRGQGEGFAEVRRVLKPGATFAIFDVMRTGDGDLRLPLHWSPTPATSFVASPDDYSSALQAAGFDIVNVRNRRDFALQSMQQRVAQAGQPIGLPVVMGATAAQKLANMREMIERGVFAPTEIIARAA